MVIHGFGVQIFAQIAQALVIVKVACIGKLIVSGVVQEQEVVENGEPYSVAVK